VLPAMRSVSRGSAWRLHREYVVV